jgi:ABC-type Fe3+/spermidine/putrescine transport system ATPase subunit
VPTFLHIDGLTKRFGTLTVLDDVSLEVAQGEVLALLGPSGSGKTTLLRILAGFETADAGTLTVDGREVGGLPASERGFGMVFQHYALFPHLSVADNVAFGLETGRDRSSRPTRGEIASRVDEMLALVDLAGFGPRPIDELSGGQQQRVALARALAPGPRLLLLDEPLSNLDPALRERTRREIRGTVERVGITTVLVTHEQEEAFHLGDRVAVLHDGKLEQVATPEELYLAPASRFVAGFVGRSSNLSARVEGGRVRVGDVVWPAELGELAGAADGTPVSLTARPESLRLVPVGATGALPGRVTGRRYAGLVTYFLVDLDGVEVEVLGAPDAAQVGDAVAVAPRQGSSGLGGAVPALRAYPFEEPADGTST